MTTNNSREGEECSACGHPITACKCGKPRVVVCAANQSRTTGRIICGARHWDLAMRQQAGFITNPDGTKKMPEEWAGAHQGFIDQYAVWMTREEAWMVAEAAGQIKYRRAYSEGTLFSEDLY